MKNKQAQSLIKSVLFVAVLLFIAYLFSSCSTDKIREWENTYVIFNPDNLEEIYVLNANRENTLYNAERSLNLKNFLKMPNGENYLVEFQETEGRYQVAITTKADVDFITFSGFVGLIDTEQEWARESGRFYLEAAEIDSPEEGNFYYIELSNDLNN